jgi:predicted regulator of Ras-like GTPase activity (Roadblock/LC7/MglB family)
MLDDLLHGVLAELPGARCVVLTAQDGVVVAAAASREGPSPDVVAASLADLFRKVSAAHREAGLVPPTEFTSGGSSEQAALRVVTGQYLLVAVIDGAGSLGQTRFHLRKAAAELESELD